MRRSLIVFFLLFTIQFTWAQAPVVNKYFEWFQHTHIIQSPSFENTGDNVVFVKRFIPPDTGRIKMPVEEKLTENLIINRTDAGFRNPVVAVLNSTTRHLTLLDYGWAPAFSKDGKRVVYANQQRPLTESKIFAKQLTNNGIKMFDFSTKKIIPVIEAPSGFLLNPVFIDSLKIIYEAGAAVNGPYAGGIGLNEVDLKTKKVTLIALPKVEHRLYNLIGEVYKVNNGFAYVVYSPRDSGSGALANEYEHILMNGKDTLHNFGIRRFTNLQHKFVITNNELVFLDDSHLLAEDTSFIITYKNGNVSSKKAINFNYANAWLAPDGKKMLYITAQQEGYVLNVNDFSKTAIPLPKKEYHAIAWSADASKLAIIQDHSTIANTDALYLFTIK